MRHSAAPLIALVLAAGPLGPGAANLAAQPPVSTSATAGTLSRPAAAVPAPTDSIGAAIEAFARLQRAIDALRDREQAELAEPRNKKVEEQATIRARYVVLRADSLKAHGYTPAQVSTMTRRLSSDDALRAKFEAAMERLAR